MKTLTSVFISILVTMQIVASGVPSIMFTYAPPKGEHGSVVGITQNVDKYVYGVAFFENVYCT